MAAILVTNDDGVDSPGLWALVRAVQPLASDVVVVAPAVNQSAVGASITVHRELSWSQLEAPPVTGVEAWQLDGTPADCVMVALDQIVKREVGLVVSGVNRGANMGHDILASGTVGGALHGHLRGIPAIAFSQAVGDTPGNPTEVDWSAAERVAAMVCRSQFEGALASSVFLNVNVPRIPFEELAGILGTRMGRVGYIRLMELRANHAVLEREVDLHTHPETPPGTDVWALAHGYVSITPLQSNLTDHRLLDELGARLNAAFRE